MASKKKKNTAVTVISCILLVLVVLGAVGLLLRFTNGFTEDFKSFYLVHDGERILNKQNQLLLGTGEEQSFEVHYTFEAVMDNPPNGYSVRIVPRATAETDFEFTVDGAKYLYSGEKDLTKAFDIVEDEDFFTLTIPHDLNMRKVLEALYPGQTVTVPDVLDREEYYYTLVVTSYNEKSEIRIDFRFYTEVESVTLDQSGIVL